MPNSNQNNNNSTYSYHHEIVAPGFGTQADLDRLAKELSENNENVITSKVVQAVMASQGRGLRRRGNKVEDTTSNSNPLTSPTSTNAWASFMQEEGVMTTSAGIAAEDKGRPKRKAPGSSSKSSAAAAASYDLDALALPLAKKLKSVPSGTLVQSGTLDSTLVGRKALPKAGPDMLHLTVPTVLLPMIQIRKVVASCSAAHALAIDASGSVYGWGRNEQGQLGKEHGKPTVPLPTKLSVAQDNDILTGAVGKGHSVLVTTSGQLLAIGSNKTGQCGLRQNIKASEESFKPSLFLDTAAPPTIVKVACGEDFTLALDTEGYLYSSGSSEYGQLGNGETGEYFVTANKLAFTNSYGFCRRSTFQKAINASDPHKVQLETIGEVIRLSDIACGKHHSIALEAATANNSPRRVFSWGCGSYGCLGHGRQHDEFYPRQVVERSAMMPGLAIASVAAGSTCSLVVTPSTTNNGTGHVYYWGKHKTVGEATMRPTLVSELAHNGHVVSHVAAGHATVLATTTGGATVVWGQGPVGELGIGDKKSSSKPTFCEGLAGKTLLDLAGGQGSMIAVVDSTHAKGMPTVDKEQVEKALPLKK